MRIAVSERAAYDLYLSRTLQHATLHRARGLPGAFKLFVEKELDALAGLVPALKENAKAFLVHVHPGPVHIGPVPWHPARPTGPETQVQAFWKKRRPSASWRTSSISTASLANCRSPSRAPPSSCTFQFPIIYPGHIM